MRILILFVLVFFALEVSAICLNPFGCDKELPPPPKEPLPKEKVRLCSYTFRIVGEKSKPKVLYVFSGPCGGFKHVGIIDLPARKLIHIHKEKVVSETIYRGKNRRAALIDQAWGQLIPIHFYEQMVVDEFEEDEVLK